MRVRHHSLRWVTSGAQYCQPHSKCEVARLAIPLPWIALSGQGRYLRRRAGATWTTVMSMADSDTAHILAYAAGLLSAQRPTRCKLPACCKHSSSAAAGCNSPEYSVCHNVPYRALHPQDLHLCCLLAACAETVHAASCLQSSTSAATVPEERNGCSSACSAVRRCSASREHTAN